MRRALSILASAVLALGAGLGTALPASATDSPSTAYGHSVVMSPYVALGDSYSSAAGVLPTVPGSPPLCSRSRLNYPHDIAFVTRPRSFTDVSCSGATTSDFSSPQYPGVPAQLDAVDSSTRLVTMTIGGNDGNAFSDILGACISASAEEVATTGSIYGDPCKQKYGPTFDAIVAGVTYPNLVAALTKVHAKAPYATVAILGYPHALPAVGVPSCYPSMPISMGDVPYVDDWAQTLNTAVEKAAADTGTRFIDMGPSSVGHDACQPFWRRWVEPFNGPINAAPVHPNAFGEAAMAAQTLYQLRH